MTELERARERWEIARDILCAFGQEPAPPSVSIEASARFQEWWRLAAGERKKSRRRGH